MTINFDLQVINNVKRLCG